MISETHLLWSLPTSLDRFVFDMPHRVYGNIYDILIALVSHYSIRGCPNVSHTEPGPGYVVKRDPLHCSPCLDVRGQVYAYMGLWSMLCHVRLFWYDLLWPSDMTYYVTGLCPYSDSSVLWHQRRGVTTFLNPIHDLICICTFASRTGLLCLR